MRTIVDRFASLSNIALFAVFFAAVALTHLTLLQLPYYWDEGGYYIPAALDFYHTGALIPHFTNAHPPLPNILLGSLWPVFGFHILTTRLVVCTFAATALVAVFRLTQALLGSASAAAATLLTGCYSIWFAQSTLAHADIFAAAFTLCGFALYFQSAAAPASKRLSLLALLFSLAALSKETAIIQPAALALVEFFLLLRNRNMPNLRRTHLRTFTALSFPALPLLLWYAYHRAHTGFTFGNPEYLRYNATANFTVQHFLQAMEHRSVHLFWERNIWLPLVLTLACFFLPQRSSAASLPRNATRIFLLLIAANWIAFSILGGALLTRYLLPVYPLILILCVSAWRERTQYWPLFVAFTTTAFIPAIWLNPAFSFAPEDNLTYRDMIVVHQEAISYVNQHYPSATVLTGWPVSTDFFQTFLGYTDHSINVFAVQDFSIQEIQRAAQTPGSFDTAVVFTTHYASPALLEYLRTHPYSHRGDDLAQNPVLTPAQVAAILGGRIVFHDERDGEWVDVIHFDRSYEAVVVPPSR